MPITINLLKSKTFSLIGNNIEGETPNDFQSPPRSKDSIKSSFSPDTFTKTPGKTRILHGGKTVCRCGAANCRGYFF